jgi:hypothetical protein
MSKKRQGGDKQLKEEDMQEINQVFKTLGLDDESVRDSLAHLRTLAKRKPVKHHYQIRLSHTSDYVFGT